MIRIGGNDTRDAFMKRRQTRRDCFANRVWLKWVKEQGDTITTYANCVADESKQGYRRSRFEAMLMENGCYLSITNGMPEIKGFSEESLIMLTLRYG